VHCCGRLFQTRAAGTGKARSPMVDMQCSACIHKVLRFACLHVHAPLRQSRVLTVDLSDPIADTAICETASSRGAEPGSESAASSCRTQCMEQSSTRPPVTLIFSSAASRRNYFVEHSSLVHVSASGRSVNSAIQNDLSATMGVDRQNTVGGP